MGKNVKSFEQHSMNESNSNKGESSDKFSYEEVFLLDSQGFEVGMGSNQATKKRKGGLVNISKSNHCFLITAESDNKPNYQNKSKSGESLGNFLKNEFKKLNESNSNKEEDSDKLTRNDIFIIDTTLKGFVISADEHEAIKNNGDDLVTISRDKNRISITIKSKDKVIYHKKSDVDESLYKFIDGYDHFKLLRKYIY